MEDTSSMPGPRSFPSTVWSDVLAAGDPSHPACRAKLEHLMRLYWRPVYAYIRAAGRKSPEEAKDVAQGFFAHLLEKDAFAKMRPERGSFRGFVKRAVKNFLVDGERAQAIRRPAFSIDAKPEELDRLAPEAAGDTPERAYDREWFRSLFAAAIDDLRRQLAREGKIVYFDVFRMYCLDPADSPDASRSTAVSGKSLPDAPTYREIAEKLGIKETDVTNYLSYCRAAAKKILRARVRDYVGSDDEVERELAEAAGE
ncbi:MAG: sigma-70 family RNA polymerase sigma factor [Planctomycetes bacterium]|nr:sigma-70 family RNA polymerase sigma factor [Planctomycetota bacterium]